MNCDEKNEFIGTNYILTMPIITDEFTITRDEYHPYIIIIISFPGGACEVSVSEDEFKAEINTFLKDGCASFYHDNGYEQTNIVITDREISATVTDEMSGDYIYMDESNGDGEILITDEKVIKHFIHQLRSFYD
jgi:hypothetical protein